MTLAKKGSRRITVEGATYRWILSANDGYMVLIVEEIDASGQRLEGYFAYHDRYEPTEQGAQRIAGQRCAISPGVVRRAILAALAEGWRPKQRGLPSFQIRDTDRFVSRAGPPTGRT